MNTINEALAKYIPDFDLNSSDEDIETFEKELSDEEDAILQEILSLEQQVSVGTHFMSDLLDAVKKGALDYIDAMTDTTDSISDLKRSEAVQQWDETKISPINTSANKNDADSSQPRRMKEANKSALRKPQVDGTIGMSESGQQLFRKYEEAYRQRTKSLTQLSKDGKVINRSDTSTNYETLAGLRGYRIGPVVSMPTAAQAKDGYDQYIANNGGTGKSQSSWLYDENMNQFDSELVKQFGFHSIEEARTWRKDNKLTVHEGPDGMFMVPSDVHSSARHDGYRSMMSKFMKGEISKEEMDSYIRSEKIAYAKHEARERGCRMMKGIGLTAIKDVLKCTIVVMTKETINEFQAPSKDTFVERMFRVIKQSWIHVRNKCKEIINGLWSNIKGSVLSEVLTALNDFFFRTFKNIFKVIRQMWYSIKNAFKIICSKDYSASEKMFEVMKVLTAGFVSVVGFSMNELMEKGLISLGIPFAGFISECISGLFAGIMSAVVLMLFDNLKEHLISRNNETQLMQLRSKRLCVEISKLNIESLKFYKKLDKHVLFALSPLTSVRLDGSILLCEDLGVSSSDICRNEEDVDAIMRGIR